MKKLKRPLVSVLVPLYNVEQYIGQCLDSIIEQTYDNLEIILVDDGTPDNAGAIADDYAKRDKRIRVIHQQNGGLSSARNTALDNATGAYVTFVDGDDYLAPDFVEYMLKILNQTNTVIAMSRSCFTTNNTTQSTDTSIETITSEDFILSYLYPRTIIGAWNKMYDRSFLEKHRLRFRLASKTGEGMTFITFSAQLTGSIGVGSRKVYYYRTDNSSSATTKPDVQRQGMGSLENLNYICNNISVRTPRVQKALEWHRWACYRYILQNIIGANEQNKYRDLYQKSIHEIRTLLPLALTSEAPAIHKTRAIITAMMPALIIKAELVKRNYRLKTGKGK